MEGVAEVTLDRREVRNAFNDEVIGEFLETWKILASDSDLRAMILRTAGDTFCSGADLKWMKAMAGFGKEENLADAGHLYDCMDGLFRLPVPTVCRVQGPAFGGALGLIAACDIVIASSEASFAFTEVRLGLAPAVISPFVARKLDPAFLREVFLTGRRFSAIEARDHGLVTEVVGPEELDIAVDKTVLHLLKGSPEAQKAIKELLDHLPFPSREEERRFTSALIADLRAGKDGQEGITAFFERRNPRWVK